MFEDRLQEVKFTAQTISNHALELMEAATCAESETDKVVGAYTRANCDDCEPGDELTFVRQRLLTAHEAMGGFAQAGFMYSWNDAGGWYGLDFTDTYNTCVRIYDDGRARIGGVVKFGNGPQVGRAFGFHMEDQPGPAFFNDKVQTVRFSSDYDSETARQYAHYWCQTGELQGEALAGYAEWPGIVIDGSFVICNLPMDGD